MSARAQTCAVGDHPCPGKRMRKVEGWGDDPEYVCNTCFLRHWPQSTTMSTPKKRKSGNFGRCVTGWDKRRCLKGKRGNKALTKHQVS